MIPAYITLLHVVHMNQHKLTVVILDQLHANRMVHFDLKPRNILVMSDMSVILCDLDASMRIGHIRDHSEKAASSAYYAPEVECWSESLQVELKVTHTAVVFDKNHSLQLMFMPVSCRRRHHWMYGAWVNRSAPDPGPVTPYIEIH